MFSLSGINKLINLTVYHFLQNYQINVFLTSFSCQVKLDGALKVSRQKLKIDIKKGMLSIIKGDDAMTYDHTKG